MNKDDAGRQHLIAGTGTGKSASVAQALAAGDIGQALLAECKRRGISQAQASERFGVTKQAFNEWVNRKRDVPARHVRELATFLRVPVGTVRMLIDTPRKDRIAVLEYLVNEIRKDVDAQSAKIDEVAKKVGIPEAESKQRATG
jgi:transcriptional regulator with XRE-family HTH domain